MTASDRTIAAAALYDALGRGANYDVETIAKALGEAERAGMRRAAEIAMDRLFLVAQPPNAGKRVYDAILSAAEQEQP